MTRSPKPADPEPLVEAVQSFASEWIDLNALSDFPGGVVRKGTLLRADHPVVKQHADQFRPGPRGHPGGQEPARAALPGGCGMRYADEHTQQQFELLQRAGGRPPNSPGWGMLVACKTGAYVSERDPANHTTIEAGSTHVCRD